MMLFIIYHVIFLIIVQYHVCVIWQELNLGFCCTSLNTHKRTPTHAHTHTHTRTLSLVTSSSLTPPQLPKLLPFHAPSFPPPPFPFAVCNKLDSSSHPAADLSVDPPLYILIGYDTPHTHTHTPTYKHQTDFWKKVCTLTLNLFRLASIESLLTNKVRLTVYSWNGWRCWLMSSGSSEVIFKRHFVMWVLLSSLLSHWKACN